MNRAEEAAAVVALFMTTCVGLVTTFTALIGGGA